MKKITYLLHFYLFKKNKLCLYIINHYFTFSVKYYFRTLFLNFNFGSLYNHIIDNKKIFFQVLKTKKKFITQYFNKIWPKVNNFIRRSIIQ